MRPRGLFPIFLAVLAAACARPQTPATPAGTAEVAPLSRTSFVRLSNDLSEEGGYFPSDNLVSNETAYLEVLPTLGALGIEGGAYVGVGPDQNFSYIAAIHPALAYIIDIRRDNLLQQLLFKALFEAADSRFEYLSLMLGVPMPADRSPWDSASLGRMVAYFDSVPATDQRFEAADSLLRVRVESFGYPLSAADLGTIRGIHMMFYRYGLGIRYSMRGRGRFGRFPTWQELLLATDLEGRQRGYLASEESFRYVQQMERENRIVPVVGDLSGDHALAAIGADARARGLTISAFYVSNVEQYLMREPAQFKQYAATVTRLPYAENSVLIRSYFTRRWPVPQTIPGHFSTQLLERFTSFVREYRNGGYRDYRELVTKNVLPLQSGAGSARSIPSRLRLPPVTGIDR